MYIDMTFYKDKAAGEAITTSKAARRIRDRKMFYGKGFSYGRHFYKFYGTDKDKADYVFGFKDITRPINICKESKPLHHQII